MNITFSVQDYFQTPAINISSRSNQKTIVTTGKDSIEYVYNSYGYRTYEFTDIPEKYILTFGSSHTEGTGLHHGKSWTCYLEKFTGIKVYNLGIGGTTSSLIVRNITSWLSSDLPRPKNIIIDWPPLCRLTYWNKKQGRLCSASHDNFILKYLLKLGDENFWLPWLEDITIVNELCKANNVSPIHLFLNDSNDDPLFVQTQWYFKQNNIEIHIDEKLPGKSWLFDNQAADEHHHSELCHQSWAGRIAKLI